MKEYEKQFEDIYNNTYQDILKYVIINCYDFDDVNDIIQDTYLELFKILKRHKVKDIKPFLFGVTKNILKRYKKKLHKNIELLINKDINDKNVVNLIHNEYILEDNVLNKITSDNIWNYLKEKELLISKTFYLFYAEGLTIKEISKVLNINESSVKNYLYRTKKELQIKFKEEIK